MRTLALALAALLVLVAFVGCIGEDGSSGADTEPSQARTNQTEAQAVPVAWGDPAQAPIRPGASLGGYCTYNWLYTAANGTAYIGTAGHCTTELGERVSLGPDGAEIGTVVYDSDVVEGADPMVDFSLIRLDDEQVANAHPRMLGWGGPEGYVTADDVSQGDQVALHGYGIILGDQEETRDRWGVLVSMDDRLYQADMPAVNGDSGSPLIHMDSGKALGIISHYGIGAVPPSTDEGPTMAFIFSELEQAGWNVELATMA